MHSRLTFYISFIVLGSLFTGVLPFGCTPKISSHLLTPQEAIQLPEEYETPTARQVTSKRPCRDRLNYIPDTNYLDHYPIKYLRVNFHYINSTSKAHNFSESDAVTFTKGWMHAGNYDLNKNNKMWLPHNNDTPVLPNPYRMVLTPQPDDPEDDGIYFHYNDTLFYYIAKGKNRNLMDRRVVNRYAIGKDSILNIFIMAHHPDSVASPTYTPFGTGVMMGNAIKMAGMFENTKDINQDYWAYRGCFNHEVGHFLGLSHTWRFNDGCDDTPRNPQNCWNRNQRPGCDTTTSNNVMDYNAMQHAWTPCQIGRMQERMLNLKGKPRKYLQPNWCTRDPEKDITITDQVTWPCDKDLEGNVTIATGGALTILCRVSVPKNAKISVAPGATLILDNAHLHNSCGDQWAGIEIQELGKERGQVQFVGTPTIENTIVPFTAD